MGYGSAEPTFSGARTLADLHDFRPTLNPEIVAHPQPVYHQLRDEAPILETPVGVVLTRHEDVMYALRHPEVFSSNMDAIHLGNDRPLIPLQIDPPEHVKYRKLLDPLFAPREVNRLQTEVRLLMNRLVDEFIEAGSCEYASAVAVPLPCTVFLALMGLPRDELDMFLTMKNNLIRPPGGFGTAEAADTQRDAAKAVYAYFQDAIDERRRSPRDDLMTRFTTETIDGRPLSDEEILDICFLFLMAGLDTVTASLGCSMVYLARHPDQRRELIDDPHAIPSAVEELLRWEGVVPGSARILVHDVDLHGRNLTKGTPVHVLISAANLDPDEFPEPDRVDFHRESNRHLAFGAGVHRCLGSHLARLELRVALHEWHRRIPEYGVAPGETPVYVNGLRAVEYLSLVFPPGAREDRDA